jgi:hypothetical protein
VLTGTPQTQAIVAGPNVFVSGQIPADTKGNLIEGSIADKTKMCCENIKGILTEAGVAMDRIVKVRLRQRNTSCPIDMWLERHTDPEGFETRVKQGTDCADRSTSSSTTWQTLPR